VELMVVIAIIAILIGILLPSMKGARDRAEMVVCMNKQRNIATAALTYSVDNKDQLVALKMNKTIQTEAGTSNYRLSYSDLLFPYLYSTRYAGTSMDEGGDGQLDVDPYDGGNIDLFRCPAVEDHSKRGGANVRGRQILDYGINHYGFGVSYQRAEAEGLGASLGRSVNRRNYRWAHPSRFGIANPTVIYWSDAEYDRSPEDIGGADRGKGQHIWPFRFSFERSAHQRHFGGYVVIQLDGAGTWHTGERQTVVVDNMEVVMNQWLWRIEGR
jgi:competence protein ComGC